MKLKDTYYYMVRALAWMAVKLFYGQIEINGRHNIPEDSSNIIFAPNHQSAFLDAILVAVYSSKPISFLTRADVFVFPFNLILRSLNMMPVYRIRDGYGSLSKNEAVFETCRDLIHQGRPILLFPEASQSLVYYLRPLSKGLSRIAYRSQEGFDKPVYIVPVGINYYNQFYPGARLALNFGPPINVKELIEQSSDKLEAIASIRTHCSEGLKSQILIPDNDDSYERKLVFLQSNYFDVPFQELKDKMEEGRKAELNRPHWGYKFVFVLFALPNLLFHLLEELVIKIFISDRTFEASIRISLIMFAFPLYLLGIYIAAQNLVVGPAILFVSILALCYYTANKLRRYFI